MTKQVRITNADCADFNVKITPQYMNAEGEWVDENPMELNFPGTALTLGIHTGRRLIIEENGYGDFYWTRKQVL